MKNEITLILNYQEQLIIRHSLESYADKWCKRIRAISDIANSEKTNTDIKKKLTKEIRECDTIRISTQRLWKKVSEEMYGNSRVHEHIKRSEKI